MGTEFTVRGSQFTGKAFTANCKLRSANYTHGVFQTIPPPPRRLLIFARLPERGKVKTRLASAIGDDRALAVYEAMLRDVLASIGRPGEEMEIEIVWAPSPA